MKYILKYRANTFLPPDVADILETAKADLLALSREPDKATIFFDAMRKELINWFSYHAEIETEPEPEKKYEKKTGCEYLGCPYWNGYYCCDNNPKYDAICQFNDYWKNQGNKP
jgi:hypothetical protein